MFAFLRLVILALAVVASTGVAAQQTGPARDPRWDRPAQREPDRREAEMRERDVQTTQADSVRRVERETGGEVLRAERMQRGGHDVYRLKVLTPEGRVRVMQDDPRSRRSRFDDDASLRQAPREQRQERDDEQPGEF